MIMFSGMFKVENVVRVVWLQKFMYTFIASKYLKSVFVIKD